MNRYRTYLDDKPPPAKKSAEQIDAEIKAYLATGGKVQEVNRGATALNGMPILRPKVRT